MKIEILRCSTGVGQNGGLRGTNEKEQRLITFFVVSVRKNLPDAHMWFIPSVFVVVVVVCRSIYHNFTRFIYDGRIV